MEYSVNKLSKISGISARTLRYYDEIGLLKPARVAESGYRLYGQREVDLLQQILFYRELGFSLEDIKLLLSAPDFDRMNAFTSHLSALYAKRERLDVLIKNVAQSVATMKGEEYMTDQEKFAGFAQQLIDENEQKYGAEAREKYGDAAVDQSNAHLKGLTRAQYDEGERLRLAFEEALRPPLRAETLLARWRRKPVTCTGVGYPSFTRITARNTTKGWRKCTSPTSVFGRITTSLGAAARSFCRRRLMCIAGELLFARHCSAKLNP
jgi:DNA-binding transcriptional MerR regulator